MKIASLFSGAGGLDLGFIMAGHEIVFAVDNFDDAVETYKLNLGNHIAHKDIENISSLDIPNCDIVIGGFPCQGFSLANMKRTCEDSRNKLYQEYLRILIDKKPKYFVAENVKGILSLDKGNVFRRIIDDFKNAGYKVKYKILNAADFGVPQIRERVIIIGTKCDCSIDVDFPQPTHFAPSAIVNKNMQKWISVGSALSSLPDPDKPNCFENHTYSKFKLKFNGYLGNRMIHPEKPAPTVTARGDNRGGVVVLHHPSNKRRMTARELAAVQGFPLDYRFCGCRSSVYRQIANAVPPPLAKAIAVNFPFKEQVRDSTKIAL